MCRSQQMFVNMALKHTCSLVIQKQRGLYLQGQLVLIALSSASLGTSVANFVLSLSFATLMLQAQYGKRHLSLKESYTDATEQLTECTAEVKV